MSASQSANAIKGDERLGCTMVPFKVKNTNAETRASSSCVEKWQIRLHTTPQPTVSPAPNVGPNSFPKPLPSYRRPSSPWYPILSGVHPACLLMRVIYGKYLERPTDMHFEPCKRGGAWGAIISTSKYCTPVKSILGAFPGPFKYMAGLGIAKDQARKVRPQRQADFPPTETQCISRPQSYRPCV